MCPRYKDFRLGVGGGAATSYCWPFTLQPTDAAIFVRHAEALAGHDMVRRLVRMAMQS